MAEHDDAQPDAQPGSGRRRPRARVRCASACTARPPRQPACSRAHGTTRCADRATARRPARRGPPAGPPTCGTAAGDARRCRARPALRPRRRSPGPTGRTNPDAVARAARPRSTSSSTKPTSTPDSRASTSIVQRVPGDLPDAVTRREARARGRLVLLAGVESGQTLADDLQRHVPVPLLAQHEPQALDVGRASTAGSRPRCGPAPRDPAPRGTGKLERESRRGTPSWSDGEA